MTALKSPVLSNARARTCVRACVHVCACVWGGGLGDFINMLLGYGVQTKLQHVALDNRQSSISEGHHRRMREA
jgi:hypothetical protein